MSSASIQKLFCGICSALKCSFDEFVREKVVSMSYSSASFTIFFNQIEFDRGVRRGDGIVYGESEGIWSHQIESGVTVP